MTTEIMESRLFSYTDKDFHSFANWPDRIYDIDLLCKPAFTEAVLVRTPSDAFEATLRRLYQGEMDYDAAPMQRTSSHHSNASTKSQRSQTLRSRPRKYASYTSSSASSVAPSDKSLTSFPSFSPESPKDERISGLGTNDGSVNAHGKIAGPACSIVDTLTTSSSPAKLERRGLFDDEPLSTRHVPGAIHLASDEHIDRLIARNGAAALVRQIAGDLAQRDAQIAALRRKTEERERALRKIILECGLSNLDLETRLRVVEEGSKTAGELNMTANYGGAELEGMINDAMSDTIDFGDLQFPDNIEGDATIRASEQGKQAKGTTRGWKDFIWGAGQSGKASGASSVHGDAANGVDLPTAMVTKATGRRTILQNGAFQPPESGSIRSSSRASSIQSGVPSKERKSSTSLAALALRLVAGNPSTARDNDSLNSGRGRSNSATDPPEGRNVSSASRRTVASAKGLTIKAGPKGIPAGRRTTVASPAFGGVGRSGPSSERWDTMGTSPQKTSTTGASESYGPVEMDAILPLEAQPPTLTNYSNNYNPEFLTDRFGFIYDQRRKKRQREAAETVQKMRGGERREMLSSARGGLSPDAVNIDQSWDIDADQRPDTPASNEDRGEDGKPAKRWQDYLKVATFPTELLSHTPFGGNSTLEVLEGEDVTRSPPPGAITTEERGFVPAASTTASSPMSVVTENATISKPANDQSAGALTKEDMEPVKILLEQLSEVHDSLQRDKTVKWNDFLRKVRAERKREGEAAAAALAATTDSRSQRPMAVMPEATLTDGEMIGVAGLGNKGKVGRAKWNEFKTLVLGGIPVAYRAKIWAECSGAMALRVPGYYDDLVARREEDDDPVIVAQIQMDINRTLTDNIFFRRGPGVTKLNEVLLAYSRRNAEVGYCQGMNLITACLLLIMPTAEDAFWLLTSIIENILPRGYYDHSLLASRADQQVLRQYVASILPKLSFHLDELGIELEALTFQWFLSVFTDCLSAEALFRVWDVVFCTNDGSTFLFQIALALLKLNEQQLLQCQTPAGIYTYINHQMTNHAISIDGLIHASEGLRKVVKREDVEARRAKAIEAEKDLLRQREARNNLRKAEKLAAASSGNGNGPSAEAEVADVPVKAVNQVELGSDAYEELVVRTPMPLEAEVELALG